MMRSTTTEIRTWNKVPVLSISWQCIDYQRSRDNKLWSVTNYGGEYTAEGCLEVWKCAPKVRSWLLYFPNKKCSVTLGIGENYGFDFDFSRNPASKIRKNELEFEDPRSQNSCFKISTDFRSIGNWLKLKWISEDCNWCFAASIERLQSILW